MFDCDFIGMYFRVVAIGEFEKAATNHACLGAMRFASAEAELQFLAVAPAQAEAGAVFEHNSVFAVRAKFHPAYTGEVDDGRAMDTAKDGGIQSLLESRHTAAQQVGAWANVQARVVVGSLDPVDLGDLYEPDLPHAFDGQALQFSRQIFAVLDSLLGAVEGSIEAGVVEGVQQVIERSGLESPQRVMVVGSHKDYGGRQVLTELLEHVEPVTLRHLHVEKEQVRHRPPDFGQRSCTGRAFGDDFDFRIAPQQHGNVAAGQSFVVHNKRAYLRPPFSPGTLFRAHRSLLGRRGNKGKG